MLNAYPDSIGENTVIEYNAYQMPEFKDVFFAIRSAYFFNSDLDRVFYYRL
jgi:hypothetical protein